MMFFSSWFLYAITSALAVGLFAFSNKVNVARGHNPVITAFLYYLFSLPLAFVIITLYGAFEFAPSSVLLGLVTGVLYPLNIIFRQKALNHMSASLYFMLMRLTSGMILLLAGIFLFNNSITSKEWVGFAMGLVAFILLFQPGKENFSNKFLGLKFLALTVGLIVLAHISNNFATIQDRFNVYDFYFVSIVASVVVSLVIGRKEFFSSLKSQMRNDQLLVAVAQACLGVFALIFSLVALESGGDLGIVYKVISYSILVPILLSSIFYGERFNKKTGIAFALILISLWLFV